MGYKILRSKAIARDFELIFDHLYASYTSFGDTQEEAFERAEARIMSIEANLERLGELPHQGEISDEIYPGLRHVTKGNAIYYYLVDDEAHEVRVLAVFFGGQDHRNHMLRRLLS